MVMSLFLLVQAQSVCWNAQNWFSTVMYMSFMCVCVYVRGVCMVTACELCLCVRCLYVCVRYVCVVRELCSLCCVCVCVCV